MELDCDNIMEVELGRRWKSGLASPTPWKERWIFARFYSAVIQHMYPHIYTYIKQ